MQANIYYPSHDIVINPWDTSSITSQIVNKYYIKMCEVDIPGDVVLDNESSLYEYLESLFALFNSEDNPLCSEDSQDYIIKNKLHTSMSIGDIIKINDKSYCASTFGFTEILQ